MRDLAQRLRLFAEEREWQGFHTPKNLSMAVAVEAGELLELFQWLSEEQSANLTDEKREAAADEIADVLIYLVRLADVLDIDPLEAAERKIARNAERYPVSRARGNAVKYTELSDRED